MIFGNTISGNAAPDAPPTGHPTGISTAAIAIPHLPPPTTTKTTISSNTIRNEYFGIYALNYHRHDGSRKHHRPIRQRTIDWRNHFAGSARHNQQRGEQPSEQPQQPSEFSHSAAVISREAERPQLAEFNSQQSKWADINSDHCRIHSPRSRYCARPRSHSPLGEEAWLGAGVPHFSFAPGESDERLWRKRQVLTLQTSRTAMSVTAAQFLEADRTRLDCLSKGAVITRGRTPSPCLGVLSYQIRVRVRHVCRD